MADDTPRIVNITATPGDGTVKLAWDITGAVPAGAKVRVHRDGKDSTGTGEWKTFIQPEQKTFTFTKLKKKTGYNFTLTIKDGDTVLDEQKVSAGRDTQPNPDLDAGGQYPPPASKPVVSNVKVDLLAGGRARVSWDLTDTSVTVTVARDGKDTNGHGGWSAPVPGTTKSYDFTRLRGDYTFTVTPAGGEPVTAKATVKDDTGIEVPVVTEPPKPDEPATPPGPGNGTYLAMTLGASVYHAADGGFNAAFGKRHGLYATWGQNGKIWAIDHPGAEYGTNSVARLGDYDLDIAPQRLLSAGWSGAANGRDDKVWESDLKELKNRWGNRRGHIYYRPWHEFNGNWYAWSVRSRQDQEDFKKAFARFARIFNDVFGGDKRFHLSWSPNRDSKYGLDLSNAYPDAVRPLVAPDYYDFALRLGASKAAAESEKYSKENGNGPRGIMAYINFAKEKGVPVMFPEWGVQFGDNTSFLEMVLPVFTEHRYTGNGDPAGKILGIAWHNLLGKSVDPNAGGNFLIVKGNSGYDGRRNAFRMYRDWVTKSSWLRTV